MRIAYLSSSIIPSRTANSIHVIRMCAAYASLGHEVILFAPERRKEAEKKVIDVYGFYGVPRTFEIRFLPWPRVRFRSLWYAWKLRGALNKLRPDLIHSRFLPGSAWLPRGKSISIFESHAPITDESRIQGAFLSWLCRREVVSGLVVISHALADRTLKDGLIPHEKLLVAPDGADFPPTDLVPFSFPGTGTRLQVGYIGQLYAGKGMELIGRLALLVPGVDFHIVGGMENDLALWKSKVIAPNITFHGFVEPAKVPAYIAGLDVCLLPNQRDVRTFTTGSRETQNIAGYTSPLKLFEYMAHGKAIVASRLPVLQEILNESLAVLADPELPEEWKECIQQLSDPKFRARLGGAAREVFTSQFSWQARAGNVMNFVRTLQ